MSMKFSVYVGAYFKVPKGFAWYDFEELVCECRMEAANNDGFDYLISNRVLEGCNCSVIKPDDPVRQISNEIIAKEQSAFYQAATKLIEHFEQNHIEYELCWGIIPCYF